MAAGRSGATTLMTESRLHAHFLSSHHLSINIILNPLRTISIYTCSQHLWRLLIKRARGPGCLMRLRSTIILHFVAYGLRVINNHVSYYWDLKCRTYNKLIACIQHNTINKWLRTFVCVWITVSNAYRWWWPIHMKSCLTKKKIADALS